jgi:hypothetical protein
MIVVVEEEAQRVRLIFRRHLEVTGINEAARDLKADWPFPPKMYGPAAFRNRDCAWVAEVADTCPVSRQIKDA